MFLWYTLFGLILLFVTQRSVIQNLTYLIQRLGGGRKVIVWSWSILFLPGTILHELSHLIVATFVGLRTGKIQVFPEFLDHLGPPHASSLNVALGSVQVQKPNPIQGFLVGVAPFFTGTASLIWLVSLMSTSLNSGNLYLLALQAYLFFAIGNSFFPSLPDLKQTIPLFIFLFIFAVLYLLFGPHFSYQPSQNFTALVDLLNQALFISVTINFCLILVLQILRRILPR